MLRVLYVRCNQGVRCYRLCVRVRGAVSSTRVWGLLCRWCRGACTGDATCSTFVCKVLCGEGSEVRGVSARCGVCVCARCGVCARVVCV